MLRQTVFLCLLLVGMAVAQKPYGMLQGYAPVLKKYPANTRISEFTNSDPVYNFSQVNGQLVVQREGVYYVFAQVFFENYPDAPSIYHNRVELTINEKPIAVLQTPIGNQADYGSESSGAVLRLKKGDLIGLKTVYRSAIWLTKHHTFFGAYSINL